MEINEARQKIERYTDEDILETARKVLNVECGAWMRAKLELLAAAAMVYVADRTFDDTETVKNV